MKFIKTILSLATILFGFTQVGVAQDKPTVKIPTVVELTGAGQTPGTNFKKGADLAIREINATGGILGRKIETQSYDTQSDPATAKAMVQRAIDQGAYVVLGPAFSGSVIVSMEAARAAEIPNFVGAEAANITQQGNPYVFRTSFTQTTSMPKVARYIKNNLRAKTVAVMYINNDFGKGGHDQFLKAASAEGISVTADVMTEPGQVDYTAAVQKLKQANADAIFVYLNDDESARALQSMRVLGVDKPIIGETTLVAQKVIDMARGSANGARAHVGLTPDAPSPRIRTFRDKYTASYYYKPDHNSMKGYTAIYVIKAVTERLGRFDPKAFAVAMKNMCLSAREHPGLLIDLCYDEKGDIDRESFLVEVRKDTQEVVEVLPPLGIVKAAQRAPAAAPAPVKPAAASAAPAPAAATPAAAKPAVAPTPAAPSKAMVASAPAPAAAPAPKPAAPAVAAVAPSRSDPSPGDASTVRVVCLAELSGDGKTPGTNYRNGVEMAFREINAAGGILGRKIAVDYYDTRSVPAMAKALARRAGNMGAFAVTGPAFSGSVIISMEETQKAEIPNFVGAEALNITAKGNPYVFRTSFSQATSMPKLARYIASDLKAKSVAFVWVNNDFGKGGHEAMLKALAAEGVSVTADIPVDAAETKMLSAVAKAKAAKPDALFVYMNEDQSVLFLKELKKEGFDKPVLGETTLIGQKVIDSAEGAAEGVRGHVGLTINAPNPIIKTFADKFERTYGYKSDHNGMKGYFSAYALKAATERVGRFDSKAVAQALHGMTLLAKDYPNVLLDVRIDDKGDIDRESYLVEVRGGKQVVIATLPPLAGRLDSAPRR